MGAAVGVVLYYVAAGNLAMRPLQLLHRKCSRRAIAGVVLAEALNETGRVEDALVLQGR
jgi:hypothetical protein